MMFGRGAPAGPAAITAPHAMAPSPRSKPHLRIIYPAYRLTHATASLRFVPPARPAGPAGRNFGRASRPALPAHNSSALPLAQWKKAAYPPNPGCFLASRVPTVAGSESAAPWAVPLPPLAMIQPPTEVAANGRPLEPAANGRPLEPAANGRPAPVERALRAAWDASPLLMGTIELPADGEMRDLYANPAAARFFGPDGAAAAAAGWQRWCHEALAQGTPVSFDYLHEPRDGRSGSLLAVTVTPLENHAPGGGATCCYVAEDVGGRRRAETAMRHALESTSDGLLVLTANWRIELMNHNAMAMIAEGRNLTGQNIWEAFPEAVGGPFWKAYHRCMSARVPTQAEEYCAPLAKTFSARAFPFDDSGVTVFLQDVSEARAAERSLHELTAILDLTTVFVRGMDGTIRHWSAGCERLYGWSATEAVGRNAGELLGCAHSPEEAINQHLATHGVWAGNLEHRTRDGRVLTVAVRKALHRDAAGVPTAVAVAVTDMTSAREAEAALARSNEEARTAAERVQLALAAGAIVGTWDWELPSDRFTVDERFAESFGIDPALGRTGLSLEQVIATVHPDDIAGLRAAIDAAIQRGGPYSREYRVRGRDGQYRWIEANGRVYHSPDGTPQRFPGVLIEVGRRRALEAERDRAAQLLRAFIEAVPGVVYAKDSEGRLLMANRGTAELVGKPPEEILGKTDLEFLEHKEQAAAIMATDRRIMDHGRPETLEEELDLPDGSHAVWLSTKAPFRDSYGQVIGLVGSSMDITARKDAESTLRERTNQLADAQLRLEIALSAGRMGVWDWSPVSGQVRWNPQMFDLLGLPCQPDGQARGDQFIAMVHPDDRATIQNAVATALAGGADYDVEIRVVRADGKVRWVLGRARVLHDAHGQPQRMVGINMDITERKIAEQSLVDADRRRNEFLAMLGHELRNPLAPIANAVQLLELAGAQAEPRDAALQIIRRQTANMARLVDDLLEVSRVTQGNIELRRENIPATAAIHSAVETIRPLVLERNQTLKVDASDELILFADQARITQVLANLLNNASKYTQPGGQLSVRALPVDDAWGEIAVADNGPGIDSNLLPRVFDLFSQGTNTLDRSRGGLGLGLALVHRLVDLHGGCVRAESAGPGMGATFTVRLPRAHHPPATQGNTPTRPTHRLTTSPARILVVDDNLDAANTLATLLETDGHRVATAHDGEEALVLAKQFNPRIVLLDIGLPKLDGWQVASRLRADPATAHAVLIAISGYGQAEDRQRSRAAGFNHHLLKPVDLDAVYAALENTPKAAGS